MTRFARTERAALCDLALELGPEAPTLSGGWTVKDLVVHLLLREGSLSAAGVVVPPLKPVLHRASERLAREDLSVLVEQLRQGPPAYSPFRLPPIDTMANSVEYFVHHEDVRRAQDRWEPRDLDRHAEDLLWRLVRVLGKGLVRSAKVGVVIERSDTAERATLKKAPTTVVVRGLPSEIVLFVYGRQPQSRVELDGSDADVASLTGADLGI